MEVSHMRQLKDVERALARLKQMYANLSLEHHCAQRCALLKSLSPAQRLMLSLAMQTRLWTECSAR